MKMQIETIFKHGSYYGIGGALGDHIIGARDEHGRPIFIAGRGSNETTCLITGNHEPLAATARNRRHLKKQMENVGDSPSVLITLPGGPTVVMLFPHRLADKP